MDLSKNFYAVASGNVVRISTLEVDRRYPIIFAQHLETQFGPSVLLTLQVDSENSAKVFLPKCYTEVFRDEGIENINDGTKFYHLVYRGRKSSGDRSYILSLEY